MWKKICRNAIPIWLLLTACIMMAGIIGVFVPSMQNLFYAFIIGDFLLFLPAVTMTVYGYK